MFLFILSIYTSFDQPLIEILEGLKKETERNIDLRLANLKMKIEMRSDINKISEIEMMEEEPKKKYKEEGNFTKKSSKCPLRNTSGKGFLNSLKLGRFVSRKNNHYDLTKKEKKDKRHFSFKKFRFIT